MRHGVCSLPETTRADFKPGSDCLFICPVKRQPRPLKAICAQWPRVSGPYLFPAHKRMARGGPHRPSQEHFWKVLVRLHAHPPPKSLHVSLVPLHQSLCRFVSTVSPNPCEKAANLICSRTTARSTNASPLSHQCCCVGCRSDQPSARLTFNMNAAMARYQHCYTCENQTKCVHHVVALVDALPGSANCGKDWEKESATATLMQNSRRLQQERARHPSATIGSRRLSVQRTGNRAAEGSHRRSIR